MTRENCSSSKKLVRIAIIILSFLSAVNAGEKDQLLLLREGSSYKNT